MKRAYRGRTGFENFEDRIAHGGGFGRNGIPATRALTPRKSAMLIQNQNRLIERSFEQGL